MYHREFEPPLLLRDTIKCFWYNNTPIERSSQGFEVMPDGYAEIIFHFGSLYNVSASGVQTPLPSPFMMGLLDHPAHFFSPHSVEIIGVRCYPWTVFDLLGLPSGKGGVHVFQHPVAALQPQLASCMATKDVARAIAYLEHYFIQSRLHVSAGLLHKAGIALTKANGALPVSRVAEAAHATVRTLERKFKQSSGHTVKDVAALMRFEQVRNRLWAVPQSNLAGLAHELGYADQSHLSREFKRYSGTTPSAFARKALKDKPVLDADFVSFVPA